MLLDVQTISKQIIKPSNPTPQNSQTILLSSLDQSGPQMYTHIILFYASGSEAHPLDQIPFELKASLSKTLTYFYPLAGRIKLSPLSSTLHVECNDEGVEFLETRTEADLDSFLLDPRIDQFGKLLPIKVTEFRWVEDPLLAVQASIFRDTGFALGISMSHMFADGASMALFLNRWGEIARGIDLNISKTPQFDSAAVFPPQLKLANRPLPQKSPEGSKSDNVVIKRFVISSNAIARLRKGGYGRTQTPTRVEAVSAFVLRCLNRVRGNTDGNMMTSVNLRKKISTSTLSENSIGNVWIGVVTSAENTGGDGQRKVEESLRSAVRSVDEEYVRRRESLGWEGEGEATWIFSSWCRLSLYRSDFGYGEPIWLGCGIKDMKDVCILIDAKDGDGIEVWLWLESEEMERVERDQEFLRFMI